MIIKSYEEFRKICYFRMKVRLIFEDFHPNQVHPDQNCEWEVFEFHSEGIVLWGLSQIDKSARIFTLSIYNFEALKHIEVID